MSVIPHFAEALGNSKFGVRYSKLGSAPTPYFRTLVHSYPRTVLLLVFIPHRSVVRGPVVRGP